MKNVVVFAYHTIGVEALKVLLKHKVKISLIVTHNDNPNEYIWFSSVKDWAVKNGIQVITPEDPNDSSIIKKIKHCHPDLIFSFYYRHMLSKKILKLASQGAYNLHGSLLPKYRGRVPINWAIIHGETETGATLHVMTKKPDQGDIVAQAKVPIYLEDTAKDVFDRVTQAAVKALDEVLPQLLKGTAAHTPQRLSEGSYFSGRKAEDGRINWQAPSLAIHNLVRAVAPPYPGAFTSIAGQTLKILRTSLSSSNDCIAITTGGDGQPLYILAMELDGQPLDAHEFKQRFPNGVRPDC